MRMFGRFFVAAVLVATLAGLAAAADVEGLLLDRMCAPKLMKQGQQAAQAHTRDCNLMPNCLQSGFGVFTAAGKFIILDAAGNKLAETEMRASQKKDNLRVKVTGEQTGDTIKVASLKLL